MTTWKETYARLKPHPRERLKLVLGSLFHPRTTQRWLTFVRTTQVVWQKIDNSPKLLTRIYRPYGFEPLTCRERVDVLLNHYATLNEKGLTSLLNLSLDKPLLLSEVTSKSASPVRLYLASLTEGHREGEMSLLLEWDNRVVFTVSFLLASSAQHFDLIITRLHGNRDSDARDVIRQATKAFYGCRPGVLITHATRQLANVLGCQRVLLVSNRQRVALNPVRRRQLKTDLDTFWRDLGAQADGSGFFSISPTVVLPQDFSDVPSQKRADAKRKVALLTAIFAAMQTCLVRCLQNTNA
jgi:uncharacterized protein VirK/YbjX